VNIIRVYLKGNTSDKDVPSNWDMYLISLHTTNGVKIFDIFNNNFKDIQIEYDRIESSNFYTIKIKGFTTFNKLRDYFYVLCNFILAQNEEYVDLPVEYLTKIFNILYDFKVSYFFRYYFKYKYLFTTKGFNAISPNLSKNLDLDVIWKRGTLSENRKEFIFNNVNKNIDIIDIGCNMMNTYGFKLAEKNKDIIYHAIDIDSEIIEKLKDKVQDTNIELYNNIDEYQCDGLVNIVISEVIEHIELNMLDSFIKKVLKLNYETIIITTPNKDFNVYYELEVMRHDDHKFEFTEKEFKDYFDKFKLNIKYYNIGDVVNGSSPSIGCIIKK
jgi:hypothetical protein